MIISKDKILCITKTILLLNKIVKKNLTNYQKFD